MKALILTDVADALLDDSALSEDSREVSTENVDVRSSR